MLKRRFTHPLVAILIVVAMLCQGTSVLAGTTGTLSGVVMDSSTSQPITGASVSAVSPSQSATVTTDTSGHFVFLALAPDTYVVSADYKGYDSVVQTGVNVFADQTRTLTMQANKRLQTIGRITTRSNTSLVRPGTTTDVYSISASQQDKVASAGGGGNLNSAWSAIATVPGVFVAPNQNGYIGAGPTLSIRGGEYDQIGYEIDGVPVNRSFDNYPSGPASSLGQQELQVYTGVPPANAEANGLSGFINQVIRTGTYPGFASIDLGVGGPSYYHKASFEVGGSSPNRNFSYYLGLGGYNQDYRFYDQGNGSGLSTLWGTPLSWCDPSMGMAAYPSCYTNGNYNGNTMSMNLSPGFASAFCTAPNFGGYPSQKCAGNGIGSTNGSFWLGAAHLATISSVVDRDSVVNLHFGFPHKDGTKGDLQFLGMVNFITNKYYSSTNDQGGATLLNNSTLGQPFFFDGYQYTGPTGTSLPSNYQQMTRQYFQPNSSAHAFSGAATGFQSVIPVDQRDGFLNNQGIFKMQYTHPMGTNALFKVYGYTYYSDWLNTGPQSLYGNFFGVVPGDYELSAHTRGLSASFIDQINSTNLLNITGSYTTASVLRSNNTTNIDGAYASSRINARTVFAVLVDSTNPTNGLCYTFAGVATTCNPLPRAFEYNPAGPGQAGFASIRSAFEGTIPAAAGVCGGGPCQWFVVGDGNYATFNQVTPKFMSGSITDEFKPNSKLTINAGVKFDSFAYTGADTSGTAARTLWYNAFNRDTCINNTANTISFPTGGAPINVAPGGIADKVVKFGLAPGAACPGGLSSFTAANPTGQPTATFTQFEPRLGATYAVDNSTVLRFSYGKYAQGPNSAFEQYNGLQQDFPYTLYNTYGFQAYGFTSPLHPVRPEVSTNYDFSFEHSFKGDMSVKITPFLRQTQDQIDQFYLNQQTSFVSGLNVGKQTSQGVEFELDKGNFAAQGMSARLSFTYTNSYTNFIPLANGGTALSPVNNAIASYNAYTSKCGPGGSLVGTSSFGQANCGSTVSGAAAAPCYTPGGAADPACLAGSIANPYWSAPAQLLQDPNGRYAPFSVIPGGIAASVSAYGAPYVASLVVNERVGKFSIAPVIQYFAGARYGAPLTTEGVAPDTCTGSLANTIASDPRYPYGAPGGRAFDSTSCGAALANGIPNPFTKGFDRIGAFVGPSNVLMHMQMTYDLSKNVTLVLNATNLVSTCFGGTSVPWAVTNACGYTTTSFVTGDIGNLYNPGATIQPYLNTPYVPAFGGSPFSLYLNAKIKI